MNYKNIADKVVEWCCVYYELDAIIKLKVGKYSDFGCWGTCTEGTKENYYNIEIAKDQSLRGFVATVVHEMIHVKQWETGKWKGTGEQEASNLQYKLTDKLWKENLL
mgnify:CR=1 FL=1